MNNVMGNLKISHTFETKGTVEFYGRTGIDE